MTMRKKLRAVVCLATGLGVLSVSGMGGDLITQASAKSTAEAQDKAVKRQMPSPHTITAVPGNSDGVVLDAGTGAYRRTSVDHAGQ